VQQAYNHSLLLQLREFKSAHTYIYIYNYDVFLQRRELASASKTYKHFACCNLESSKVLGEPLGRYRGDRYGCPTIHT